MSVFNIFNISNNQNEFELPSLYWIPKVHKNPYKQKYRADSSKCFSKPLLLLFALILTGVKEKIQEYCTKLYSRNCVIRCEYSKFQRTFRKSEITKVYFNQ